jgi:signal transduction histidine kinase
MYQSVQPRVKNELHSPFFPFKIIFGVSFILFSLSALSNRSLVNETAAFALRFADISTLIILSFFLLVQNNFIKGLPAFKLLGAAVFSLAVFTLLSLLQYTYPPFDWEITIGSFVAGVILNLGRISESVLERKFVSNYTISLSVLGLLVALIQIIFNDKIPSPYVNGKFNSFFIFANIINATLLFSGCMYFRKILDSKTRNINIFPLVYYFAFIALTRFFVIFAEKPELGWWIICIMRYGTNIIAISYLVSAYHLSLKTIEERNIELEVKTEKLMIEAKKSIEKQHIIEAQRAKLLHSAQMASIAKLSGIIAHEINNPITSISLNSEILLKRNREGLSVQQEKRISNIYNLTIRINEIIKRFLALSHLQESDKINYVNLNDIVKNVVALSGTASTNNIDLTIDPIPDVNLNCNPVQISQALLNLLFNSFDFVKDLQEKWVHIAFETYEGKVAIKIIDSGKGLPLENVDKIMDPFFTTKDVNEGQGLGLSISKSYVEENKGRLFYEPDSPNTCFIIELPFDDAMELRPN